jgi:IS30 family transposase
MFRPDRGRKHLCLSKRAGIISISSAGKSLKHIADELEVSKSAVAYWQQRFRDTGKIKRKSDSNGKPKPNREDIENIRSTVLAKPITTASRPTQTPTPDQLLLSMSDVSVNCVTIHLFLKLILNRLYITFNLYILHNAAH